MIKGSALSSQPSSVPLFLNLYLAFTSILSLHFLSCSLRLSLVLLVCVAVDLLCMRGLTVYYITPSYRAPPAPGWRDYSTIGFFICPTFPLPPLRPSPPTPTGAVLAADRGSLFEGTVEPLWRGDRLLLAGHHWPGLQFQTWNVRSSMCRAEAIEGCYLPFLCVCVWVGVCGWGCG